MEQCAIDIGWYQVLVPLVVLIGLAGFLLLLHFRDVELQKCYRPRRKRRSRKHVE